MDYCCYLREEAEYQDGGGTSQLSAAEQAEEHVRNQESFPLLFKHMATKSSNSLQRSRETKELKLPVKEYVRGGNNQYTEKPPGEAKRLKLH